MRPNPLSASNKRRHSRPTSPVAPTSSTDSDWSGTALPSSARAQYIASKDGLSAQLRFLLVLVELPFADAALAGVCGGVPPPGTPHQPRTPVPGALPTTD